MRLNCSWVLLVLSVACTEYGVNNKIELAPEGDELVGEIQVDPEAVALVGCSEFLVEVMLSNVGEGDLEVSGLAIEGSGAWTLQSPEAPFVLQPGVRTPSLRPPMRY